jgi:hypothetical protein
MNQVTFVGATMRPMVRIETPSSAAHSASYRAPEGHQIRSRPVPQMCAGGARGISFQNGVQEIRQPHPSPLQLKFDHRVRLLLVSGSNRRGILVAQVTVRHGLCKLVPFKDPILDAALRPGGPVCVGDVTLQLRSQFKLVPVDVFQPSPCPRSSQGCRAYHRRSHGGCFRPCRRHPRRAAAGAGRRTIE